MTDMLAAALAFHDGGFCVVPARPDGTKAPAGKWQQYQQSRPSRDVVAGWLHNGTYDGFGVICGTVSGNLEMLELEGRAVAEGLLTRLFDLATNSGLGDLWRRVTNGYTERTPSGGIHVLYRVDGPAKPNTKLARRPATTDELADAPKEKIKVLAETRGEGGFVVVAPSGGRTHPTGQPWTMRAGGPATIATVTADERDSLHALAAALDQMPEPEPAPSPRGQRERTSDDLTPGDDYNKRADWAELLQPRGWTRIHQAGPVTYWRRPEKRIGISATTGRNDGDNLYVFSTSTEFEAEKPYSKFSAYTLLEHAGDYSAAARHLAGRGYGTQRRERHLTALPEPPDEDYWEPDDTTPEQGSAESSPAPSPRPVAATGAEKGAWPPPIELGKPDPAPLPIDACGPILGPVVAALSESLQTPSDLAINVALSVISTAAQGRYRIRIQPDWTEILSISSTSVANSGERKTPVLTALTAPLAQIERHLRAKAAPDIAWRQEERALGEARVAAARKAAAKDRARENELRAELEAFEALDPLHPPQLIFDDATPEALIHALDQQHGAAGVLSAEPGFFATLAGRYSNGVTNLDGVLKATSGERIRVNRISRDPIIIDNPCLTIAVMIQPGLLEQLGKKPELRYAGLLARFLYAYPTPRVGNRSVNSVSRSIYSESDSVDSVDLYKEGIFTTTTTTSSYIGTPREGQIYTPGDRWAAALKALAVFSYSLRTSTQSTELTLDNTAAKLLTELRTRLEPRLHPHTGDLANIADWGSKLPGTAVRIAAALTLLTDPHATVINAETMAGAIRLAIAYIPHAAAVLDNIRGHSDGLDHTRDTLSTILRNHWTTFSQRDIHRALAGSSWVKDATKQADVIADELDKLTDLGHIRPLPDEHDGPGRKPSPRYEVNPTHIKDRT